MSRSIFSRRFSRRVFSLDRLDIVRGVVIATIFVYSMLQNGYFVSRQWKK